MTQVLDHGYVKHIESWGHGSANVPEAGIIEAARQSTQGSFRGWDRDQKLLQFLYENKHSTPFEFAGMTIEVQAPIFVFREWHRHRTQSYSEMSARYEPIPYFVYIPSMGRLMMESDPANKQAGTIKGAPVLSHSMATKFQDELKRSYDHAEEVYQNALTSGVPKELARACMPVGRYSRMRATGNLRNWLGFLTLRMAPDAQWEIRQFANDVGEIIATEFPQTWRLFNE